MQLGSAGARAGGVLAGRDHCQGPQCLPGAEDAFRQAPAGQVTSGRCPDHVRERKLVPGGSGLAATSTPATAPHIRISRPGVRAGLSARPVIASQAPTTRNVTVITHRSVAPGAASALT